MTGRVAESRSPRVDKSPRVDRHHQNVKPKGGVVKTRRRPYIISNFKGQRKLVKGVTCGDLLSSGCELFDMCPSDCRLTLEDGSEVDDEYLAMCGDYTALVILGASEHVKYSQVKAREMIGRIGRMLASGSEEVSQAFGPLKNELVSHMMAQIQSLQAPPHLLMADSREDDPHWFQACSLVTPRCGATACPEDSLSLSRGRREAGHFQEVRSTREGQDSDQRLLLQVQGRDAEAAGRRWPGMGAAAVWGVPAAAEAERPQRPLLCARRAGRALPRGRPLRLPGALQQPAVPCRGGGHAACHQPVLQPRAAGPLQHLEPGPQGGAVEVRPAQLGPGCAGGPRPGPQRRLLLPAALHHGQPQAGAPRVPRKGRARRLPLRPPPLVPAAPPVSEPTSWGPRQCSASNSPRAQSLPCVPRLASFSLDYEFLPPCNRGCDAASAPLWLASIECCSQAVPLASASLFQGAVLAARDFQTMLPPPLSQVPPPPCRERSLPKAPHQQGCVHAKCLLTDSKMDQHRMGLAWHCLMAPWQNIHSLCLALEPICVA